MARRRTYLVGEVARITGVSVRTLHHYDAIGLVVPRERSEAGYRRYDHDDLLRLQQVLLGRAQGLDLESIRRALDDPALDRRALLLEHKRQLLARADHTTAMLRAVDAALDMLEHHPEGERAMKTLFEGFDPAAYEAEVQERWGDTDAYQESARRSKRYGEAEWRAVEAEQAAVYDDLRAAMEAGQPAGSLVAMDAAERHRASIGRWFYPCSHAMHQGLAEMYVADPRFTANLDRFGAGMAAYLAEAIHANARRQRG